MTAKLVAWSWDLFLGEGKINAIKCVVVCSNIPLSDAKTWTSKTALICWMQSCVFGQLLLPGALLCQLWVLCQRGALSWRGSHWLLPTPVCFPDLFLPLTDLWWHLEGSTVSLQAWGFVSCGTICWNSFPSKRSLIHSLPVATCFYPRVCFSQPDLGLLA